MDHETAMVVYESNLLGEYYRWKENGCPADRSDESTLHEYAVTFNICNNEWINGKRWQNYTVLQQQGQLLRRLKSYVRDINARIQTENFVYETSPKTGQQHIHCIVDSSYLIDASEWTESINLKFTTRGYTTFLCEPIRNREAWKKYLRKNDVRPNILLQDNAFRKIQEDASSLQGSGEEGASGEISGSSK